MDTLLSQYNPWWFSSNDPRTENYCNRPAYTNRILAQLSNPQAVFLTGLRRVGKTTILKLTAQQLIAGGAAASTIVYVSMDDYLLRSADLNDILQAVRIIHNHPPGQHLYLLLDELTAQPNAHQQIKNLLDREQVSIVATASSSLLLKDHFAYLSGRVVSLEVQPLNFQEYQDFRGVATGFSDGKAAAGLHTSQTSLFLDYLHEGGMPEYVLHPRRDYLVDLVDDIIQKDITAFYGLKDSQLMRDFFVLLMEYSGTQISINRIARLLRIAPDTARRYLGYFGDSYLVRMISRWGTATERQNTAKKIYAGDLGIRNIFIGNRDLHSCFEHYVFMRLKKRTPYVYFVKEHDVQLDFMTDDGLLVHTTFHRQLPPRQHTLFSRLPARQRLLIDSPEAVQQLDAVSRLR
ncbi:ATP-binding protein [Spirochaeta africana]|uniref:Putative ATPase (AAA+ superfamily) n=1 Tax=Spirochaeta africana (strain ATCC 700263 / DSM 8902 / Z-7692) TaxID=889378 RepID=H9UHY7_SPIAZ|nr:ATP-binding protein [Spirochaeta africana]AFG37130.1 putative ATPase (AAA+ superfamily) [Spirochaeta africana DSM 8902]